MKVKLPSFKTVGWFLVGLPVFMLCAVGAGGLGAALGAYLIFSADLPKIPDLQAYKPKTVSTFYADDGSVIGLFYKEKRFPIPLDKIPPNVVNAFLAAEDARFFSHTGVDIFGVGRAFVKNVLHGNFSQGGSTITQQVTRNLLLTKEKKVSRKIREALLAFRLEKTLTKHRILELYLNEIYMGKGAYGIESAARTYFAKSTQELTIPEAALLAGLVANPSRFSPHRNLEGALKRREFVLGSMLKNDFITEDQYKAAMQDAPLFSESKPNPYERVPYFTESVRQYILAKYGEHKLYNEGLQVWTTCDTNLQSHASEALNQGALAWEKREGRPAGLVKRLKSAEVKEFLNQQPDVTLKVGDFVQALVIENHSRAKTKENRKKKKSQSEDPIQDCVLALQGNRQFRLNLESRITYRPNDLLEFRVVDVENRRLTLEHNNAPPIQGAVVTIENNTGYIRTLVGGLDFDRSHFNRATQAVRQPGSAFKPFIFAAALEWSGYSPNTVVIDDPIAVVISKDEEWLPTNSDGAFQGPLTLRQALAHSRNIVAIKLLMDVGLDNTVRLAQSMGITSPLRKNLSLALGSAEVSPLDLTAAYTVFPNLGIKVQPIFVKKVVDRFGKVLEDNTVEPVKPALRMVQDQTDYGFQEEGITEQTIYGPQFSSEEQGQQRQNQAIRPHAPITPTVSLQSLANGAPRVISAESAYLMLSMMRDVCISGTAAAANKLKIPNLTGKTGTTDDCTDAWFVGSNPQYTTGVWMGHDTKTSLGRREHGATAALPVWMDVMREAVAGKPATDYPTPPGIVFLDGAAYAGRIRKNALLEAGPDFAPNPQLKQISPVDMLYGPTPGQVDPYTGAPMLVNAAYDAEQVRVLTTTGETLGYGYYTKDQKGRPAVYAFNPLEPEYPAEHQDYARTARTQDYHDDGSWPSSTGARLKQYLSPYLPNWMLQ